MSKDDERFVSNSYLDILPFSLHEKLLCFYADRNSSLMGYVQLLAKNDEEIAQITLFDNRRRLYLGMSLDYTTQKLTRAYFLYQKNKQIINFYKKLGFQFIDQVRVIDQFAYFNFVKEIKHKKL